MDDKQRWRLDNLRRRDVDPDFLLELHGLRWPFERDLRTDFEQWLASLTKRPKLTGDQAPRFYIERFLDVQQLDSLQFAAAKLGMTPDSLAELLPQLPDIGLRNKYELYPGCGLIGRSLSEDLTRNLPGLRFKTFGTHDGFCELLRGALKASTLKFDMRPLYCATQDEMAPAENGYRIFASTWDNLTMLPLSVTHQVWLNLGKPLSLTPDRCSKLFYLRNMSELNGALAGMAPPRNMDRYMQFLKATQRA
jgi:hypothetical protein